MASRHTKMSAHLECPVCLEIFRDPRVLVTCGHTLCKGCIDNIVHGSSVLCPVCRTNHDVPQNGFPRNILVSGMIDSMCYQCRSAEPETTCSHCDKMLCGICHSNHSSFVGTTEFLQEADGTLTEAGHEINDADLQRLVGKVEDEIDTVIDLLAVNLNQTLEERRRALKMDLKRKMKNSIDSNKLWKETLKASMASTKSYVDASRSQLGSTYGEHITAKEMSDILAQGHDMVKDIKQYIRALPVWSKPSLTYNDKDALAAIASVGSIHIQAPDTEADPGTQPETSTGAQPGQSTGAQPGQSTGAQPGQSTGTRPKTSRPAQTGRPRVVGSKGSHPGE